MSYRYIVVLNIHEFLCDAAKAPCYKWDRVMDGARKCVEKFEAVTGVVQDFEFGCRQASLSFSKTIRE